MKIQTLFTSQTAGLAAAALLTVAFAGGCQTTDSKDRTIQVPAKGTRIQVPAGTTIDISGGSTIHVPPGGATIHVPPGTSFDISPDTIHVPPGGNGANDVSKDGPRRRRHHPDAMMTAPPPSITHPGG